jgi:DNA repair protein RadC
VDTTANGLTALIHALMVTRHKFEISETVIESIKQSLIQPEMGGILGIDNSHVVTKFYHDSTGTTTKTQYIPDVQRLNSILRQWAAAQIRFGGFVHSHPKGKEKLSSCDLSYAKEIKGKCSLSEILMLLYIPDEKKFIHYVL